MGLFMSFPFLFITVLFKFKTMILRIINKFFSLFYINSRKSDKLDKLKSMLSYRVLLEGMYYSESDKEIKSTIRNTITIVESDIAKFKLELLGQPPMCEYRLPEDAHEFDKGNYK